MLFVAFPIVAVAIACHLLYFARYLFYITQKIGDDHREMQGVHAPMHGVNEPLQKQPSGLSDFTKHGYVILRDVLSAELVASLLSEAEDVFDRRSASGSLPRVSVNALYSIWVESPRMRSFWTSTNISSVLAHVTGSEVLRLFEDLVVVTEPAKMGFGVWHSDWYSFGNVIKATRAHAHSIWIPLVDVNATSRGGSVQLCKRQDVPANCSDVDYDADEKLLDAERQGKMDSSWCEEFMNRSCEIPDFRAGDVLIFSHDVIHRTQRLLDQSFRRISLVGRFVGEGARYKPRQTTFFNYRSYKVLHDMCDHHLQEGDAFDGSCFPTVYPELNLTELLGARSYMHPFVADSLGFLERLWFGSVSRD